MATEIGTDLDRTAALQLDQTITLPRHKGLVEGKLANGLTYIILPNSVPAGRFEAHLEVLSGSAHELESQQGMAHLLEHVAYMGSPKRQLISGTGSRTNAYTDFHHTVFFAACPTHTPDQFWKRPMLPMALDALLDVMTCTVDDDRLEKERAAVLSEASMVNKMEYRVESQILSALHEENRISRRFPIGKEHLIRAWKKEDLQLYHNTHYCPDNVILFVVGDVDVPTTIECINEKFGNLRPKLDARKFLRDSGEFPELSMHDVWRHFPSVTHQWSCTAEEAQARVPSSLVRPHHEVSAYSLSNVFFILICSRALTPFIANRPCCFRSLLL
jgi:predicted Zn-dependent peptidase